MNKSHLLINEQALQVLPTLAVQIGLNEAIALQQVHYWINNVKNAGRVDDEGNKWVYNTYAQWQEDNFPFWSEDKVQRVFLSLEKLGLLIARQLDAKSRDMTKFYRIDYDALCAMDDAILRPSNTANLHDVKMNQRLPENTNTIQGIEASIMQGRPTTQEDIDPAKVQHDTLAAFEVAFKLDTGNIAWFNTKPEWGRLRRKLVDKYQLDPDYFKKYHKWYTEEGKFAGGMNVQQMRRDPDGFILAMNIFEAASVGITQKTEVVKSFPKRVNGRIVNE